MRAVQRLLVLNENRPAPLYQLNFSINGLAHFANSLRFRCISARALFILRAWANRWDGLTFFHRAAAMACAALFFSLLMDFTIDIGVTCARVLFNALSLLQRPHREAG